MSRPSVAADPVEVVRDALSRGVTGCLRMREDTGKLDLYVMQGEILAAHSPADPRQLVRRLRNGGAITIGQAERLLSSVDVGHPIEALLLDRVPEDLLLDLLAHRFRQNLLDFVSCTRAVSFAPLEAIFVENIQTGHDSFVLLNSVCSQRDRIRPLRQQADRLLVRPGPVQPGQLDHARLLDLCEPQRLVSELVDLSPFEAGPTLSALSEMADQGVTQFFDADAEGDELIEADSLIAELAAPPDDDFVADPSAPASQPGPQPLPDPLPDPVDLVDLVDLDPAELQPAELQPVSQTEELDDPETAQAIRRAREIEEARAAAALAQAEPDDVGVVTRPPGFDFDVEIDDGELAFFEDQDVTRGAGKGQFVTEDQLLDVVDLSEDGMAAFQRAMQLPTADAAGDEEPLAMAEATEEEAEHAVALSFTGPHLDEADIRRKIGVVNDVMVEISRVLDKQHGRGSGRVSAQILVDGPPTRFAPLFRSVQVGEDGKMNADRMLKNVRKRPEGERRRLMNEALLDLIQRALSTSVEDLEDDLIDEMLEHIAGYQQRMGL